MSCLQTYSRTLHKNKIGSINNNNSTIADNSHTVLQQHLQAIFNTELHIKIRKNDWHISILTLPHRISVGTQFMLSFVRNTLDLSFQLQKHTMSYYSGIYSTTTTITTTTFRFYLQRLLQLDGGSPQISKEEPLETGGTKYKSIVLIIGIPEEYTLKDNFQSILIPACNKNINLTRPLRD